MICHVLSFMLLSQCRYVLSQDESSKLEILPSTARIIPGDYVIMLESTADASSFIETLNDDDLFWMMNVLYVYHHTSNMAKPLQGLALSNVSDVGLQTLLESELVDTITPVRLNETLLSILNCKAF